MKIILKSLKLKKALSCLLLLVLAEGSCWLLAPSDKIGPDMQIKYFPPFKYFWQLNNSQIGGYAHRTVTISHFNFKPNLCVLLLRQ